MDRIAARSDPRPCARSAEERTMPLKLAFVGFRHGHILSLYELARTADDIEITGACEEDEVTREQVRAAGTVAITHEDYPRMLAEVDCDAVAVGDAFGLRGRREIAALSQGKHVISDKPLCTRLAEVDQIEELARSRGLKVGCMLTMRDAGWMRAMRNLILEGAIGEIHAITFGGQHPLLLGSRSAWFFEPDMHGGTINDIGIHAIDAIPWMTGLEFARLEAARCWNAFAPETPHFHDGAQMMLTLDNGCGVLGDVSYFAPDRAGYSLPQYWRTTVWGRHGILEAASGSQDLCLVRDRDQEAQHLALPSGEKGGYLRTFRADIEGEELAAGELNTAAVLSSARLALRLQEAADRGLAGVEL